MPPVLVPMIATSGAGFLIGSSLLTLLPSSRTRWIAVLFGFELPRLREEPRFHRLFFLPAECRHLPRVPAMPFKAD